MTYAGITLYPKTMLHLLWVACQGGEEGWVGVWHLTGNMVSGGIYYTGLPRISAYLRIIPIPCNLPIWIAMPLKVDPVLGAAKCFRACQRRGNTMSRLWRRWLGQNPDYLQEVERGLTQDLGVRPERLCGRHNLKDAENLWEGGSNICCDWEARIWAKWHLGKKMQERGWCSTHGR